MKRVPIVSFDLVRWDDGTFEFSWRDLSGPNGVGVHHVRYDNIHELVEAVERIVSDLQRERKTPPNRRGDMQ